MNPTTTEIKNYTVKLVRHFDAPADKVFQAWTDPTILTKWFGPEEVTTEAAEVDLKRGGKYQLTMKEPDGNVINHGGQYKEIDAPRKLVFTWVLDGQSCARGKGEYAETVVTLEFQDLGASTQLTLTHEFLPSEESKEAHSMGWNGSFDCLTKVLP